MTDQSISNQDAAELDWTRWKRRDLWTLDDAVCLLLSVDPSGRMGRWIKKQWYADEAEMEAAMRHSSDYSSTYLSEEKRPVARAAFDIRVCAETSRKARTLRLTFPESDERGLVAPSVWLGWAQKKGYEIPSQLADLLPVANIPNDAPGPMWFAGGITAIDAAYDPRLADDSGSTKGAKSSASGETKRLATLQKLVLAMAKARGWVPGAKNDVTGEKAGSIYVDVIEHLGDGRSISADTIRDALNEAEQEFPGKQ